MPFSKGHFVVSINPTNVYIDSEKKAYIWMLDTSKNKLVAVPFLQQNTKSPGVIQVFQSLGQTDFNVMGIETFINGVDAHDAIDKWIKANQDVYPNQYAYASWGVLRSPDVIVAGPYNGIPIGNYSVGQDLMTKVSDSTASNRNNFGQNHLIVVKDIQ